MIKGGTHAHLEPIGYHSEPSDVPYSPNQFLGWDFFAVSYSKPALASQLSILELGEMIKANIRSLHKMVLLYNLCRRAGVMENLIFYK